ncbi:MAG: hypothetical protein HUU26_00895 [Gemmatimonadaceae bacterium]|nr:hypothetical protein [Gemmatimonadaceae bacterium]
MPRKQTPTARTNSAPRKQKPSFAETPRGTADRMFRAATECIRQRERYARLVASGAHDLEQLAALRVAQVCDEILDEAVAAYEKLAGMASTGDDEWRRQANALWHAAREYRRRPASAAPAAGIKSGSLQKLALEYDLEASALLALKLALGGFRQICPDCELESRPQTFVA